MTDPTRAALERIVNDEWPEYEDHLVAGTTPSLVLDYIRRDLRAALAQPTPPAPVGPMEGITPKEWDAFEAATGTVERCVYPGCTLRDDKGQCAECDRERDHWVHGSDVKFNAGHPFRPQPTPLTDEALRARGEFEAYLFGHLSACAPSDSVFRQVWASMLRHLDNLAAALAARQEGS